MEWLQRQANVEVRVVSGATPPAQQLLRGFEGAMGVLRFPVPVDTFRLGGPLDGDGGGGGSSSDGVDDEPDLEFGFM